MLQPLAPCHLRLVPANTKFAIGGPAERAERSERHSAILAAVDLTVIKKVPALSPRSDGLNATCCYCEIAVAGVEDAKHSTFQACLSTLQPSNINIWAPGKPEPFSGGYLENLGIM